MSTAYSSTDFLKQKQAEQIISYLQGLFLNGEFKQHVMNSRIFRIVPQEQVRGNQRLNKNLFDEFGKIFAFLIFFFNLKSYYVSYLYIVNWLTKTMNCHSIFIKSCIPVIIIIVKKTKTNLTNSYAYPKNCISFHGINSIKIPRAIHVEIYIQLFSGFGL